MEAFMSRSPLTHYSTRRSPLPIPRSSTSVENAGPSRFSQNRTSRDTHRGLEPERRQWPPSNRRFWIHESPSPSSSSQDGKSSNSSSGGKSAGSETREERRVRTVSPYGSFFAEEMESDTPTENNGSFRQGDRQEHDNNNTSGVFLPTRKVPSSRNWASSQAQMAPVFFATSTGYPTFTSAVPALPGPDHYHYHDAASSNMTEIPFSALALAENSRRSQPPLSWRQGYPDHPNHPQWGSNSQYDPPPQVATAVPRDKRQTDARDGSRHQR
ncbi:hypothetical protein V8E52_001152 [Russula decolorans]